LEQQELELLAAIGQVVVNATVLEYQIAALVAVMEGRDRDRARELARRTGEAMRQLEKQVKARPRPSGPAAAAPRRRGGTRKPADLVHSIVFTDEPPGSEAAYGIWNPRRDAEVPITAAQLLDHAHDITDRRTQGTRPDRTETSAPGKVTPERG